MRLPVSDEAMLVDELARWLADEIQMRENAAKDPSGSDEYSRRKDNEADTLNEVLRWIERRRA
jgi:hypothetical protein